MSTIRPPLYAGNRSSATVTRHISADDLMEASMHDRNRGLAAVALAAVAGAAALPVTSVGIGWPISALAIAGAVWSHPADRATYPEDPGARHASTGPGGSRRAPPRSCSPPCRRYVPRRRWHFSAWSPPCCSARTRWPAGVPGAASRPGWSPWCQGWSADLAGRPRRRPVRPAAPAGSPAGCSPGSCCSPSSSRCYAALTRPSPICSTPGCALCPE